MQIFQDDVFIERVNYNGDELIIPLLRNPHPGVDFTTGHKVHVTHGEMQSNTISLPLGWGLATRNRPRALKHTIPLRRTLHRVTVKCTGAHRWRFNLTKFPTTGLIVTSETTGVDLFVKWIRRTKATKNAVVTTVTTHTGGSIKLNDQLGGMLTLHIATKGIVPVQYRLDMLPLPYDDPSPSLPVARCGQRHAVIVGISKYQKISPLQYCDEDATVWWRLFTHILQFDSVQVFGDMDSQYPEIHGIATVKNVRRAVQAMTSDPCVSHVAFVSSGHGNGDGLGKSHLCMIQDRHGDTPNKRNGVYMDCDLAADLQQQCTNNNRNTFVFLDHCYSGGCLPELQAKVPPLFATSTCTQDGYGYDSGTVKHVAWTNAYLVQGILDNMGEDCMDIPRETLQRQCHNKHLGVTFATAAEKYRSRYPSAGDHPMCVATGPATEMLDPVSTPLQLNELLWYNK